jgi:DNA-binding SARP family transcriptional activator/tetratricopeptide (TPR) repeat protein
MRVRLLGPVEVLVDGGLRPIPGLRRRALVALLALRRGEVVSTDRLLDTVWSGASSRPNTLQATVSQLRTLLGDRGAIVSRAPGYVLAGADEPTDVETAERLIELGTGPAPVEERIGPLRSALGLWRGPSLSDVATVPGLDAQARRLDHLRLRAQCALIEARLALGEHGPLIPELHRLAEEHPLDEEIHGHLIVALYRSGQQADALEVYRRLRADLRDELGVDPGPALTRLQEAILRHDPELAGAVRPVVVLAAPAIWVPAQLPLGVRGFAGRQVELAVLDGGLDGDLVAITGGAGVGKTSLAVQWGRRVADRFPDGQLHVDLRGFDPAGTPLDAAEALHGFLVAFGLPAAQIPPDLDARAGLYRSLVASRRVLVVLDNARDAQQVRPLLPGSPGCVVLVTSRDQLLPLIAAEGARALSLDLLSAADARELLARRLGEERLAAEPAAVADIVARCARLPLALSIVAARAAIGPTFPLADIAHGLCETGDGLDAFSAGDADTDVRLVFSWSYRALSADAARLFRWLGLHPGPDIGHPAVVSLAGLPPERARALLSELVTANLLTEPRPGRYTFHDLLRLYAAELATRDDHPDERDVVRRRLYDHYLRSAQAAARPLYGPWCDVPLPDAAPGVVPEAFSDADAANAWFDREQPVLHAAIYQAAAEAYESHAWRLACSLGLSLEMRSLWREYVQLFRTALAAAERTGDPLGVAYTQRALGHAYTGLGRYDDASAHLSEAVDRLARLGDRAALGNAHIGMGFLYHRTGDFDAAVRHARAALELFRADDHHYGQALALNNLGSGLSDLGDYQEALRYGQEAVDLHPRAGALHILGACWDSLGYAHQRLGHHADALTCYESAAALCRETADRLHEAWTLTRIGDTHEAMDDLTGAAAAWRQALALLGQLSYPEVEELRYKLRRANSRA